MLKRCLQILMLLFPIFCFSQFGFKQDTTHTNIQVIKNGIQQKFPWAGGLDYCQYSNIDLDLDGTQDLFIFDKTCNKIITFLQRGTPGVSDFKYAPSYEKVFESISPSLYGWVLLADYDMDGRADIFSATNGGVLVYRNTSTPTNGLSFELVAPYIVSTYNGNPNTIFASQSDIPAITDVDNDGDLDILAFYLGSCVRYYKNLSQETYGHSDSLNFKTANVCYGNFQEAMSDNTINLNTCCDLQVTDPEDIGNTRPVINEQDRHVGSTLLALDLNADQMTDLLVGDVAYKTITALINGGTNPNTNVSMISQDNNFPSYDFPVHLPIFPGAFYVDMNNDSIRDLMVSPAISSGAHNFKSNWFYQNIGADDLPDFDFQQQDFFQDEMIEYGSGALPVLFDHSGDGLLDLLVPIKARYELASGNTTSRIAYYENTGTTTTPEFTFITDDYQGLSAINGGNNWYLNPTFGDLDNDGDEDMILSEYLGTMMYFENTAGSGNPASFSSFISVNESSGNLLYEGNFSVPRLIDLNRDGLLDLVLGKLEGTLSYYENVGTLSNFEFELKTSALGGVDVSEYWTTEGMAIPVFVDVDSTYHLLVGSKSGYLHYFNNIEGNLSGTFDLVDSTLENIYVGSYSAPAIADIDGDDHLELFLGNERGGVTLFESAPVGQLGIENLKYSLDIYPNPTKHYFTIDLGEFSAEVLDKMTYSLIDITGKQVLNENSITSKKTIVDCSQLSKGIYILKLNIQDQLMTSKIILK